VGDCLLVDRQSFAPAGALDRLVLPPAGVRRGDLVIFHEPMDASDEDSGEGMRAPKLLVKRVVGLPGDRLRLRDGRVLLNGAALTEPYAFYSDSRPNNFRDDFPSLREADPNVEPEWWIELRQIARDGELTIPERSYFVLGDNRNDSEDSRYWGFVRRDEIVGRPLLVYFSQQAPEESSEAGFSQRLRDVVRQEWRSFRVLR
jgi:signal peptidase I